MNISLELIKNGYKEIATLYETPQAKVETVLSEDGHVFIRKTISGNADVYSKLGATKLSLYPLIIYKAKENNITYVVEEYISGMRLEEFIKKNNKLRIREVRKLLCNIVAGIIKLHQINIPHGNLNLSNIIVNGYDKSVIFLDFSCKERKYYQSLLRYYDAQDIINLMAVLGDKYSDYYLKEIVEVYRQRENNGTEILKLIYSELRLWER